MPNPKKKISLKAVDIKFTYFGIQYVVDFDQMIDENNNFMILDSYNYSGVVFCDPNIKNKDLILNTTFLDSKNKEVCFVVSSVTPHFYRDILDRTIRGFEEYKNELDKIYSIGDIVGYILVD